MQRCPVCKSASVRPEAEEPLGALFLAAIICDLFSMRYLPDTVNRLGLKGIWIAERPGAIINLCCETTRNILYLN